MKSRILFIALFLLGTIHAQNRIDSLDIKDFYIDFANPDITAFSILNIEPTAISKPSSVKEFAMGLTNYVNAKGDLRAGLAAEWAPFKTFVPVSASWQQASGNRTKFEWKNWMTSIATTNDSTNAKLALGFKFAPIDNTNPLSDRDWVDSTWQYFDHITDSLDAVNAQFNENAAKFSNQFIDYLLTLGLSDDTAEAIHSILDISNNQRRNTLKAEWDTLNICCNDLPSYLLDRLKTAFESNGLSTLYNQHIGQLMTFCSGYADLFFQMPVPYSFEELFSEHIVQMKAEFKKKNWNKLALQANGGFLFDSPSAKARDLHNEYYSLSGTFGMPLAWEKASGGKVHQFFRDNAQLLLQVKGQFYNTPDSTQNNYFSAGGRLLLGNADRRFSCEIAYIQQSNTIVSLEQSGFRYSAGAEFKLMENYWLELAVGGQNFLDKTGASILPSFAFRHSFGKESRFFQKAQEK